MSIAPVVKTVTVKPPPARAFALFTEQIGQWWPAGRTVGKQPHAAIVLEPHPGGRWFERDAAGHETQWGKVLAWEPPGRLLLGWQLDGNFSLDPAVTTEVELTFAPAADGGTVVRLEHRNLERLGAEAEAAAAKIGRGWPEMMDRYAAHAGARQPEDA
jgi:uncharacterized protein YndB with AHSA1/START domain